MMDLQYEREQAALERDLEEGRITRAEFDKQRRELDYDYRAAAEEAAEAAYQEELGRW